MHRAVSRVWPRLLSTATPLSSLPRPLIPLQATPSFLFPRLLWTSPLRLHGDEEALKEVPEDITVNFITKNEEHHTVLAKAGECALYLAHRHGIDMEGACEASLACTTCHCYVVTEDDHWDELPEATETEEDLLDMAPFLKPNSRLGCQIVMEKKLNGITLRLPKATRNFYVDGHTPTPH